MKQTGKNETTVKVIGFASKLKESEKFISTSKMVEMGVASGIPKGTIAWQINKLTNLKILVRLKKAPEGYIGNHPKSCFTLCNNPLKALERKTKASELTKKKSAPKKTAKKKVKAKTKTATKGVTTGILLDLIKDLSESGPFKLKALYKLAEAKGITKHAVDWQMRVKLVPSGAVKNVPCKGPGKMYIAADAKTKSTPKAKSENSLPGNTRRISFADMGRSINAAMNEMETKMAELKEKYLNVKHTLKIQTVLAKETEKYKDSAEKANKLVATANDEIQKLKLQVTDLEKALDDKAEETLEKRHNESVPLSKFNYNSKNP